MGYTILYEQQGDFTTISPKYRHLLTINKENAPKISRCLKYKIQNIYECLYNIYIDCENGTLIFVHDVIYTMSAFGDRTEVKYAAVISFDTFKKVIRCQINYYKSLALRAEKATAHREYIAEQEQIIQLYESDWRKLIRQ